MIALTYVPTSMESSKNDQNVGLRSLNSLSFRFIVYLLLKAKGSEALFWFPLAHMSALAVSKITFVSGWGISEQVIL